LKKEGIEYDVYTKYFDKLDRAICDSAKGIYKIFCRKNSDEILGASLVVGPAGDMIATICFAMTHNLGMNAIGNTVYAYPTYAEAFGHMSNF